MVSPFHPWRFLIADTNLPATYYAACDSTNLGTTVDGCNLDCLYFNGDTQVIYPAASAYDCCVACLLNPPYGAVFYFGVFGSTCTGVLDGTCTAGNPVFGVGTLPGPFSYTVSNSNCGGIKNGPI